MRGYLFLIILLLQVIAFFTNIWLWLHTSHIYVFRISVAIYLISILLLIVAIKRQSKGLQSNCFTTLLFVVNGMSYVLYLFTIYLGAFLQGANP